MVPSLKPSEPLGEWCYSVEGGVSMLITLQSISYRSEDEEEEEEEDDDGSSVEEEDDEEEHVTHEHHQQSSALGSNSSPALDLAPAYTQPSSGSNVETGSNGYAVSFKDDIDGCFIAC
jgi:hypothetical protein